MARRLTGLGATSDAGAAPYDRVMPAHVFGEHRLLGPEDLEAWDRDGYLHVPGFLDAAGMAALLEVVDEIGVTPDGERRLMQHYEMTDHGVQICRSERLIDGHPLLGALLTGGAMQDMASRLLGEPAVLYKEKINYKLPGGAGFAPHQDAPAYPFVEVHTTCMLALDDSTIDNGCLEVVAARHGEVLPLDADGCIRGDVAAEMTWTPVPVSAGDLLWFHSRAPHRSGPNRSTTRRRAMFCTYNAAPHGDLREKYYEEKSAVFAAEAEGARTRVSLIGDFQGAAPTREQVVAHERRLRDAR